MAMVPGLDCNIAIDSNLNYFNGDAMQRNYIVPQEVVLDFVLAYIVAINLVTYIDVIDVHSFKLMDATTRIVVKRDLLDMDFV